MRAIYERFRGRLTVTTALIYDENRPLYIETPIDLDHDELVESLTILNSDDPDSPVSIQVFHPSIMERFRNIRSINLRSAEMRRIAENSFQNCQNLVELNLDESFIEEIPPKVFRNCENLNWLSLFRNQISKIHPDSFYGLSNLGRLFLHENNLTEIKSEYFNHLHGNVELTIDIARNPIRSIEPRSFPPRTTSINLGFCEIIELYPETFYNLTTLWDLNLQFNPIEQLPYGIFKDLINIATLNLHATKVRRLNATSFTVHKNLMNFFMSFSELNEIQPEFFDNFPMLDVFDARGNFCVDEFLRDVRNINFEVNPVLNRCFGNW